MVDHATTGPSLRERRRQETAELITDAVLTLMAEAGIDGLTMEAVAERVGVSLRTVYRYFPDRASLLAAALARHNESVPFESPTRPDQIGATYGEVFARFDDAPAIVQAVLAAWVAGSYGGTPDPNGSETSRRRSHRPAIAFLPRKPQATAVIVDRQRPRLAQPPRRVRLGRPPVRRRYHLGHRHPRRRPPPTKPTCTLVVHDCRSAVVEGKRSRAERAPHNAYRTSTTVGIPEVAP